MIGRGRSHDQHSISLQEATTTMNTPPQYCPYCRFEEINLLLSPLTIFVYAVTQRGCGKYGGKPFAEGPHRPVRCPETTGDIDGDIDNRHILMSLSSCRADSWPRAPVDWTTCLPHRREMLGQPLATVPATELARCAEEYC